MAEKKDKNDPVQEVFYATLPCQTNVYTSCIIPSQNRPDSRILLSPLMKNFRVYSCGSSPKLPKIDIDEKMFAYLPQEGCEIISVDVFQSVETPLELITGITWASHNESQIYFNIYESGLEYEMINIIDSLELDFMPYQLTHTLYNDEQTCFVMTASDQKVHIFCYSQDQQNYTEVEAEDVFVEFANEFPSVALWVDFKIHDDKRYTAVALECGTFFTFVVDNVENQVLEKLEFTFQGPLTRVIFFPGDKVQILVLASLSLSRIFYQVDTEGLNRSSILPSSDEFDISTCCTLADLDFDGNLEILMGTFGEQLIIYKEDQTNQKWTLDWRKSFNNPIHNVFHLDLTGDGIKDIFLITMKTVLVLQHDYGKVEELIRSRT